MKVKTMQRQNGKWIARCSSMAEGDTEADAIAALQRAVSGGAATINSAMVPLPHNETFIRKCNDLGVTDIGVATAIWLWLQHQ